MKICSECEKSFGRAGNLERQIVTHSSTIQHTLVTTVETKPTHAPIVRSHLVKPSFLKHIYDIHTREKVHKCAECGDSSGPKFTLALPLFVDKPHQCKERGKPFINVGELK